MITVSGVTKAFGAKTLFENVSVQFTPGKRYGLTGPNGAGKSTFMKILQGDEEPSRGSVSIPKRVGILRQDQFRYDEFRIVDTVLMGNKALWAALEERAADRHMALAGLIREIDEARSTPNLSSAIRVTVLGWYRAADTGPD